MNADHPITPPSPDSPVAWRAGTPEVVLLALLAALVAGALALGGGAEKAAPAAGAQERLSPAKIALVQRRVERLRGLRFRREVRVEVVTPAQMRRFGLAADRRLTDRAHERVQVAAMKLLGLVSPGFDVQRLKETLYEQEVAGAYDTVGERLLLVEGVGVDEVTLAHELTHALEDQHFEVDRPAGRELARLPDDERAAATALVEGTATEVMVRYLVRYPDAAASLEDALASLGPSSLPPYVMRGLLFAYLRGQEFVAALRQGRRSWALVDVALRHRPPVSTAEIVEPERWLRVLRPAAVRLPDAARALGRGWRRVGGSSFGQFETVQLLHETSGSERARQIAGGWEGGRYALWRGRSGDALVVGWRTDGGAAAARLRDGLARWLAELPDGGGEALAARGDEVRVALAPTPADARALTADLR